MILVLSPAKRLDFTPVEDAPGAAPALDLRPQPPLKS